MTKRVAISLPDDLYRRLERVRRERSIPRSTLIQEAVDEYVLRTDQKSLEERYFAGYERIPDGSDADFDALEKAALEDLKRANLD